MNTQPLLSRVIKTGLVEWKKFSYIQQQDFKNWSVEGAIGYGIRLEFLDR